MNQATHAWVAVRAIGLLEAEGKTPGLVKLLKPYAKAAAIGAWIPDDADAKRGGSKTENHILKMLPFEKDKGNWFVVDKDTLIERLGARRAVTDYLTQDSTLDAGWWNTSYKGDPKPGQHLANRAMGLSITIVDLLLLGDKGVSGLVPGTVRFAANLPLAARTSKEQAALHFFMLSHFVADACMPCHCDGRDLSDFSKGLHNKLEHRWGGLLGPSFLKANLLGSSATSSAVLKEAVAVDGALGLKFAKAVPKLESRDVWLEVINLCRASFAVASIMASPNEYPYTAKGATAPLKTLYPSARASELEELDRMVLHDAVLNTAIVWKHIWIQAQPKVSNK